ncbi:MAG: hypothetical protein EOO65_02720 [Methanosarcinales archaeon]|nr:MAG: hypothetical protein EOO65_02720 [Methanosarcinales archaeon]
MEEVAPSTPAHAPHGANVSTLKSGALRLLPAAEARAQPSPLTRLLAAAAGEGTQLPASGSIAARERGTTSAASATSASTTAEHTATSLKRSLPMYAWVGASQPVREGAVPTAPAAPSSATANSLVSGALAAHSAKRPRLLATTEVSSDGSQCAAAAGKGTSEVGGDGMTPSVRESGTGHAAQPGSSCPVCLSTLVHPQTSLCGHVCCRSCWTASLERRGQCPLCRRRVEPSQLISLILN